MRTLKDPLTGEQFVPRRNNQRFANEKNRIRFNNNLALKRKKFKALILKQLDFNWNILHNLLIDKEIIEKIAASLPELFNEKVDRYVKTLSIKRVDATAIAKNIELAEYFEDALNTYNGNPQLLVNWMLTEVMAILNKDKIEIANLSITAQSLSQLIQRIDDGTISSTIAKNIFSQLIESEMSVDELIKDQGLEQISDTNEIEQLIRTVLNENQEQQDQYLAGKEQVLGFLIGKVMQKTQGKANPKLVNDLMVEILSNH